MSQSGSKKRRILAVVLPELLCELVQVLIKAQRVEAQQGELSLKVPLGVVLSSTLTASGSTASGAALQANVQLDAVNREAYKYGVRAGQTIAEACALIAKLTVREIGLREVRAALERVAELALAFGATAAIQGPDTVWLDITGTAHLFGGERSLASELISRVRSLGHMVRIAVADGPVLARAFARWESPSDESDRGVILVPSEQTCARLAQLPVVSLQLDEQHSDWLVRLGIVTVGDLAALPRTATAARLGPAASSVLNLCEGLDATPLVAYQPPRRLEEEITWDQPVSGTEPLKFAIQRISTMLCARLQARGEAAQKLELAVLCDRSIARLNGAQSGTESTYSEHFDLVSPLWKKEELSRVLASCLEKLSLPAPALGVRVQVPVLTVAAAQQLDLSQVNAGLTVTGYGERQLPVLLSELAADLGKNKLGVFELCSHHRPESKCRVVSLKKSLLNDQPGPTASVAKLSLEISNAEIFGGVTRLFPIPVRVKAPLTLGAAFVLDKELYSIEKCEFLYRLDRSEWWSKNSASRDYFKLKLKGPSTTLQAFAFRDRKSNACFLHAVAD